MCDAPNVDLLESDDILDILSSDSDDVNDITADTTEQSFEDAFSEQIDSMSIDELRSLRDELTYSSDLSNEEFAEKSLSGYGWIDGASLDELYEMRMQLEDAGPINDIDTGEDTGDISPKKLVKVLKR